MGEAMALTLVKAGTRLLVWNRTPAKAESFAAAGADVAREAAHVFAHCATVFLCSSTAKRLTLYSTAVALTKRPLPVPGDSRVKGGSWPACHRVRRCTPH